jgi:hypothetical protein
VRDDLNLLRADTFAAIQRRNDDLIARTGACVDVITVAAAGNDAAKFALNTALGFGNRCSLAAAILITQTGTTIRFEDASAGISGSWQAISDSFGKGMESHDVNGAVMTAVNSIADGIIAHPPPSPPPPVYASPPPGVSALDTVFGIVAANWQTLGGRLAIIAACVLAIILGVRALGAGRSR